MEIKILQVFYDKNGLPYKDKERTVHYPITSGTFLGASNTTQIRFYYDQLDELNESTFVAVSKLPNGKIGSEILESAFDEELNENYVTLSLSQFYTQYKGDVFISLQGYQGGVRVEQDENGIYQIYGTPTIQATGSIKLSIAYAPTFIGSGQTENVTLQRVLAELSTKLGIRQETLHVEELPEIGNSNVWYVVNDDPNDTTKANIYIWNATTQTYVWVGDNTLDLDDYYTKEEGQDFEQEVRETIGNGSPKGVYSTLADLQAAYPTGTTGIYVVSANGHWYYWNGSSWTDGGVYLSSSDYSLLNDKINAIDSIDIDYGTLISGKYIEYNGTEANASDSNCSDFVEIVGGKTITLKNVSCRGTRSICEYDENKNYLRTSYVGGGNNTKFTIKTFENAKYIRFSSLTGQEPILFYSNVLNNKVNVIEKQIEDLSATLYDNGKIIKVDANSYKAIYGWTRTEIYYDLFHTNKYLKVVNNNTNKYKFYIYGKNVGESTWQDVSSNWETSEEKILNGTYPYNQVQVYVAKVDETYFSQSDLDELFDTFDVYKKVIGINDIIKEETEKLELPQLFYLRKNFGVEGIAPYLATENQNGTVTVSAGGYYFVYYRMYNVLKGEAVVRLKDDSPTKTIQVAKGVGTTSTQPYVNMVYNEEDGYKYAFLSKDFFNQTYPLLCVRIDNRTGQSDYTFEELSAIDTLALPEKSEKAYYVSNAGNDNNNGESSITPFATVNKALSSGATTILICSPGAYDQQINLALSNASKISIKNACQTGRVVFQLSSCTIATSETQVEGYTKVYSFTTDKTFDTNNKWLFQNNINDVNTLISDNERNALQRGYEYRCEDTKIVKCSADNLSDALSEIENADENVYKWYKDGTTIYFSRPYKVSSSYPICGSFGNNLFSGREDRSLSLEVCGIETKYMRFNIIAKNQAYISDCKSANAYGAGGFIYDRTLDVKFLRCEALRIYAGSNGDGFNGHSYNTGEPFSKQTTCTLIDCWAHDNNDDGYSDHERSEITIIGGLYEYNQKGGITPSYGSHCTCYNVISRNNINGFYYTGTAEVAEGGKYGQMTCFNCIAEQNIGANGYGHGFLVDGTNNSLLLINCKSISNGLYGYFSSDPTTKITMIDCAAYGNSATKVGYNFTIKNTTLVE